MSERRRLLLTEGLPSNGLLFWMDGFNGATVGGTTWTPYKADSSLSSLMFKQSNGASYDGKKWIAGNNNRYLLSNINPFKDCGDNAMTVITGYSDLSKTNNTKDCYLWSVPLNGFQTNTRRMGLNFYKDSGYCLGIWDAYRNSIADLTGTAIQGNSGIVVFRTNTSETKYNHNEKYASENRQHSIPDGTSYRFALGGYLKISSDTDVHAPRTLNINCCVAYNRVLTDREVSNVIAYLRRRYNI